MRKAVCFGALLALAVVVSAGLGLSACGGGGDDCAAGQYKCTDGACHECCNNDHCEAVEVCNEDYICELICTEQGADCSRDRGACCEGLSCDVFSNTCETACATDADCASKDVDFADDLLCDNGVCDFEHCSNDNMCRPNTVCYNGDCVTAADCSDIVSCTVTPASAVTQDGETAQFSASAFLQSGALAPGAGFTWSSSADTTAAVNAAGLVTGGADTGEATITATVAGCTTTCTGNVLNYGPVTAGHTRVVVVDELAGTPINGATVIIHTDPVTTIDTGANNVADFDTVELTDTNPQNVTVFKAGYNYVSLLAVENSDLIVHLGKLYDATKAGGYKGKFSFDKIICGPGNPCEVKIGLTGPSIPGNLFNLNLDLLVGELIKTHLELGGTSEDVPLPGGLVIGLNNTWFRDTFTPSGVPGTRVAWGFGGKLNLSELIDILGPIISGGTEDIDVGSILVAILPMFADFYTALVPNVPINPIPKVVDVDDINMDDDTTDLVPDFANFPTLPGNPMVLKVPMDKEMTFSVPTLPNCGAGFCYDGVILLAGALAPEGLVPLGISAALDAVTEEDTPDGHIDNVTLAVSDVAGRLPEGQFKRVVVALALNISSLMGGDDAAAFALAGQVMFVDEFSGTKNLAGFLSPSAVSYDEASRTATITSIPSGIDYVHMLFDGDGDSSWQVLGPGTLSGTFTLPEAALVPEDRSQALSFVAIDLKDGVSYQDIPEFNSTNMSDLVTLVKAFVFAEATVPVP